MTVKDDRQDERHEVPTYLNGQLVLDGGRAPSRAGIRPNKPPIFDAIHDVLPRIRERMVSAGGRPRRDVHIEDCRLVNGQFLLNLI